MNLTDLKSFLNPSIIENSINTSIPDSPTVELKEDGKSTKLGKIKLHLPCNENLIIKLDKEVRFRSGSPLSSNKSSYLNPTIKNIHCSCDYVVISKYKNKFWINFIELKSDSTAGAHSQLYYSVPHIEYYLSLLKYHKGCQIDCEFRFLLFSTKMGVVKTTTRPGTLTKVVLCNKETGYKCFTPGAPKEFYLSAILA